MKDNFEFSLADVLGMPDPEITTATKVFVTKGKKWRVTIKQQAQGSAEDFYRLSLASEEAGVSDVEVTTPKGEKFNVPRGTYSKLLTLLASLTVSPPFGFDEWAIFGHKVGADVLQRIFDWCGQVNGPSDDDIKAEIEEAKNESSAKTSPSKSTAPA